MKYKQLTFEQRRIIHNDRIKRQKQLYLSLNKSIKYILHIGYIILIIVFIGFVGGLVGIAVEPVIYHFNKALGLGYAHYVSYFDSAIIGGLLTLLLFYRGKSNESRRH